MSKSRFYIPFLVLALIFGGVALSGFYQSSNPIGTDSKITFGNEVSAETDPVGSGVCCEYELMPTLCKTQIYPIYREYEGIAYLCIE